MAETNLPAQPKSESLTGVTEKEPSKAGCRIRISLAREDDKMIATTLKVVDYQFCYPAKTK